jgi:general secretion pathway protein A
MTEQVLVPLVWTVSDIPRARVWLHVIGLTRNHGSSLTDCTCYSQSKVAQFGSDTMYQDLFGLQKLPFNLTPDPAFLFLPPKHREALAGLTYSILERKGFVVLTGDAGTGKTTLINSVLSRLPADRLESSIVLNPTLTPSEFLESVLLDFDIADVPASKAQRLWKLQEFLARTHHQNRFAVIVIDEAHKLSPEVLEEIRLLGNFESASEKFLQILLLGQSELDDLLKRQDLRQFKQRIALRLYIDPLSPSETCQYIGFRWAKAGGRDAPPFTPDAFAGIVQWSQGIPRLINSICDSALLMAYGDESRLIGSNYVRAAAINLALAEPVAAPSSTGAAAAAATKSLPFPADRLSVPRLSGLAVQNSAAPTPNGDPKPNSSLLKRLAEKLGLP